MLSDTGLSRPRKDPSVSCHSVSTEVTGLVQGKTIQQRGHPSLARVSGVGWGPLSLTGRVPAGRHRWTTVVKETSWTTT